MTTHLKGGLPVAGFVFSVILLGETCYVIPVSPSQSTVYREPRFRCNFLCNTCKSFIFNKMPRCQKAKISDVITCNFFCNTPAFSALAVGFNPPLEEPNDGI